MVNDEVLIQILGCGNAFASGGRFNTCFYIRNMNYGFLLDCGASSIVAIRKFGIELSSINTIVISHLHGDHAGGIPFIEMAARVETPSLRPIKVIGPAGIKTVVNKLHGLFFPESEGSQIEFIEYESGTIVADELEIAASRAIHPIETSPHSLRIKFHNKIITFSGDTEWHDDLLPLADDADIFLCECTSVGYVKNHMSYRKLEKHKNSLSAKRIVLTHMDTDMLNLANCVFERGYDGQKIMLY